MSASLFKRTDTSVSRLAITPLEDTWALFRSHVEKPPERILELIGTMNVGKFVKIGAEFKANPTELSVEADPLEDYESHAVIPQKISRGVANQIKNELELHREDTPRSRAVWRPP